MFVPLLPKIRTRKHCTILPFQIDPAPTFPHHLHLILPYPFFHYLWPTSSAISSFRPLTCFMKSTVGTDPPAQDMSALLVSTAWLFSIYGWSIAHRSFELAGVEVKLGSAIWMGLAAALAIIMYVFCCLNCSPRPFPFAPSLPLDSIWAYSIVQSL